MKKLPPELEIADELVIYEKKRIEIVKGNECVGRCPACRIGFVFEKDLIERIGQCDNCFEEHKLEG
jgi:hypothetical protein